jgi:hypothetical protein
MVKLLAIHDNVAQMANYVENPSCFKPLLVAMCRWPKRFCLRRGAQSYINYTDGHGSTSLFKAACNGHIPIVAHLYRGPL